MASSVVFDAIKTYLTEQWLTSPLQFENEPEIDKTDPATRPGTPESPVQNAPWVMVEMTGTLYGQQSIGAATQATNRWDEEGQLWLHVFVPTGTGGHTARLHAKSLADLFRGTTLSGGSLEFMDAQIGMGEPGGADGAWFSVSVVLDWRYIEA